jgi:hypothetical protein
MICICIYIGAIVFAVIRVYISVVDRKDTAQKEFDELVHSATALITANSSPSVTIASPSFKAALQDSLIRSKTLQGIIVSGPYDEFHIERELGAAITLSGDTPRFKSEFGLSKPKDAFFQQLDVPNLRNATISVAYGFFDRLAITPVLIHTLLVIVAATVIATFSLLLQFFLNVRDKKVQVDAFSDIVEGKYRTDEEPDTMVKLEPVETLASSRSSILDTDIDRDFFHKPPPELPPVQEAPEPDDEPPPKPEPPPSPRHLCWESDTVERLTAALRECATAEKDLTVMVMELKDPSGIAASDLFYQILVDEVLDYFVFQDRLFERGQRGASVILSGIDLNGGFTKAGEFHKLVMDKLADKARLYIGLCAQSGRAITAERLLKEAAGALVKAAEDPVSPIVAFRSDPKKYQDFIAAQNKTDS